MSGPVNLYDRTSGQTQRLILSPSWVPSYISDTSVNGWPSGIGRINPATVYNEPNRYGLRPMSAWNKRWLLVDEKPQPLSWRVEPGYNAWFARSGSSESAVCHDLLSGPNVTFGLDLLKPPALQLVRTDSDARNNVLKKASQVKWELLATAGELKETMKMLGDFCEATRTIYRRYLRESKLERYRGNLLKAYDRWNVGPPPGAPKRSWLDIGLTEVHGQGLGDVTKANLESFRDKWMGYQMGVRPFLFDLENACDYFNALPPELLPAVRLASGASHEYSYPFVRNSFAAGNIELQLRVKGEYFVHYVVYCRKTPSGMSQATALGLNRSLSVAWELTKLSWLVDYVVDIGGWLKAWYARDDVSFVMGCKSTMWKSTVEQIGSPRFTQPGCTWEKKWSPMFFVDAGMFDRELLTSLPMPGILPNIKDLTGVARTLNAISALSHLISGRKS